MGSTFASWDMHYLVKFLGQVICFLSQPPVSIPFTKPLSLQPLHLILFGLNPRQACPEEALVMFQHNHVLLLEVQ